MSVISLNAGACSSTLNVNISSQMCRRFGATATHSYSGTNHDVRPRDIVLKFSTTVFFSSAPIRGTQPDGQSSNSRRWLLSLMQLQLHASTLERAPPPNEKSSQYRSACVCKVISPSKYGKAPEMDSCISMLDYSCSSIMQLTHSPYHIESYSLLRFFTMHE